MADYVSKSTRPVKTMLQLPWHVNLPQQRQFEFVQNISNKDLRQLTLP